jgi:hypothetical protein
MKARKYLERTFNNAGQKSAYQSELAQRDFDRSFCTRTWMLL